MVRWKLTRTSSRNQGYILDGFPKTIKQARYVFEDIALEVPDDPDEPEPSLEEEKPCADNIFPEFLIHCKASDTYLLERLQRTQFEHPHNNSEDFQRRLDFYKLHFEAPFSVLSYFESCRSVGGRQVEMKSFDVEQSPLTPPPPPKSRYAPRAVDPAVLKISEFIGKPRNFGQTPQDAHRETLRQKALAAEQAAEAEAQQKLVKEKEAMEVAQAKKQLEDERFAANKVRESERLMLEARKAPLKAYLMQQVIPVLTKGLIEVCNKKPEDPVDFLAEWLFRHNPEDDADIYQ
jgi:adenylate kinase